MNFINFLLLFRLLIFLLLFRFLRNPSELKSIKNISLLRQQMEAQAAAQQLTTGAQQLQAAAQQAVLGHMSPIKSEDAPVSPHSDEPTDLSTTTGRDREERERERIEREKYYSQLMERYNIERSSPSR